MRVLVTGAGGQLGYDMVKRLAYDNIECKGVTRTDFDITDETQTRRYVRAYSPDMIIHCAAYTAVDKAETEKSLCYAENVDGTRNIASICADIGIKMTYISTDYVFDGKNQVPYETDCSKNPLNYYGLTKSSGEDVVTGLLKSFFIVRTSWVYGRNGHNFVRTMLRLGEHMVRINVVSDQTGSPTYTADLANFLYDMIMTDNYGIYHATNEGVCSWAEFAEEIFRLAGKNVVVNHIKTCDYPTPAQRPINSHLSKSKLETAGFHRLPHWRDALSRYLKELEVI